MNPIQVLKEAIKAVPAVKYALGVAGIVSTVAIVASFGIDLRVSAFGTIITIILMVILVLFARLTSIKESFFHSPALMLTWFSLMLLISSSCLICSSVFFNWPRKLSHWLGNETSVVNPSSTNVENEMSIVNANYNRDTKVLFIVADNYNENFSRIRFWAKGNESISTCDTSSDSSPKGSMYYYTAKNCILNQGYEAYLSYFNKENKFVSRNHSISFN